MISVPRARRPGIHRATGSSRRSLPSATRSSTRAATNVFVMLPVRKRTSAAIGIARARSARPRASARVASPSRTTTRTPGAPSSTTRSSSAPRLSSRGSVRETAHAIPDPATTASIVTAAVTCHRVSSRGSAPTRTREPRCRRRPCPLPRRGGSRASRPCRARRPCPEPTPRQGRARTPGSLLVRDRGSRRSPARTRPPRASSGFPRRRSPVARGRNAARRRPRRAPRGWRRG